MREQKLQSKIDQVNEIKEKIEAAHSIVLVNYRGLNVADATELRKRFRESGTDYHVYKNTMMKRAFEDLGMEDVQEFLVGPSAIAFGMEDAVSPAKVANDFAKENDAIEIKAGVLDGKVISAQEVKDLAALPSREVLIAQVLGGLNAPIQGFANVLNGNIRGLAVVLQAIAEKKEQETA